MEFYSFMKDVKNIIDQMDRQDMYNWIYEYARTLDNSYRKEFLESFSLLKKEINFSKEEFKQFLMDIENESIYLQADNDYYYNEIYHDYEDVTEYTDSFSIVPKLLNYINIAYNYIFNKDYKAACEILLSLSQIEIFVENNEYSDTDYLNIIDLYDEDILKIDIQEYKKSLLYTMIQNQEDIQDIFEMFENMRTIVLTDIFSFGSEEIKNKDVFICQWIDLLKTIEGDISAKLLHDACQYLNDEQLLALARDNYQTHPSLYKLCCMKLFESHDVENGKRIALEAIRIIPINYQMRADIADLAIQYCADNDFYEVAFLSQPTSFHCLRLYSQDIDINDIKEKFKSIDYSVNQYESQELKTTYLTDSEISFYLFLLGEYENMINDDRTKILEIMLMLLKPEDNHYQADINLLNSMQSYLCFQSLDQYDFDFYFQNFKKKYSMTKQFQNQCILWLQNQISLNAEKTIGGGNRRSYHYVADQIVVLAQILEKEGLIESVQSYVDMYKEEYSLKRAFKTEINERVQLIK